MKKNKDFWSIGRNPSNKYRKHLLDAATKTGLDALKTASKKVAHKAANRRIYRKQNHL